MPFCIKIYRVLQLQTSCAHKFNQSLCRGSTKNLISNILEFVILIIKTIKLWHILSSKLFSSMKSRKSQKYTLLMLREINGNKVILNIKSLHSIIAICNIIFCNDSSALFSSLYFGSHLPTVAVKHLRCEGSTG